jgi:ABC-2 type transport system ATP-binding protein
VSAAREPVLVVRAARRSLGGRVVLDGVDLSVEAGRTLALLGPNGAGKTSLVRAICGRLALDSGSVRVAGTDPQAQRAARARLGLVPQELALYPDLSVRENLEVFAGLLGVPASARPRAVAEALTWADLHERAQSPARLLSGGMQRRLNVAVATLHAPALLLLDEPTVGVDPQARERLHTLLRDLRARGTALLLATHDLDQAAELGDHVAIMVSGRVRAWGTPAELVHAHIGATHELWLRLASAPGDTLRAHLGGLGLAALGAATDWTGPCRAGLAGLQELSAQVAMLGGHVQELRLREASLRGVFFRVTGREFERAHDDDGRRP